jgi:hypothetical protein
MLVGVDPITLWLGRLIERPEFSGRSKMAIITISDVTYRPHNKEPSQCRISSIESIRPKR